MIKNYCAALALLLSFFFGLNQMHRKPSAKQHDGMTMNFSKRVKAMVKMLADPSTGRIPDNMRAQN